MRCILICLLTLPSLWPQAAAIPDTPAGKALQTWLDAFNAADRGRLDAYLSRYRVSPAGSADGNLQFRRQTGAFQLVEVLSKSPAQLVFKVKEAASPTVAVGKIDMTVGDPSAVERFILRAVAPEVTLEAIVKPTDEPLRNRIIDAVIAELNGSYVYPETAKKMEAAVRARQKSGAYDNAGADDFAVLLNRDLREVSHDKHLRLDFSPMVIARPNTQGPPRDPDAELAQRKAQLKRNNCAFEKAERFPNNVGYLKFNGFMDPSICGPTASAAVAFLANTSALIIDLRDNGGGDPHMVAFLSTYFFDKPTHLNDLYDRKLDKTNQYWTLDSIAGDRMPSTPLFLLTSSRTFSGAEEFAYNLKNLKRATIVGEVTGGGAHPTAGHRLDDHYFISVPFARAINPITKTNWEGTGVEPDVRVPAAEALDVAQKLAMESMRAKARRP